MEETVLQLCGVSKSFSGVDALVDVDFSVRRGEIHCLVGENGSGKSTLIKIVSGVYKPDRGEIILNDRHYSRLTPKKSIEEGVQIIYQDFSIFPNLSVAENIAIGRNVAMKKRMANKKTDLLIAKQIVEKIGFDVDLHARVEELDVASKQLVAICRALVNDAKILIMDEPTSALTRKEVNALFDIIKKLQGEGVSIVFVSHKLGEVFEIADRFTILRSGKRIISAPARDLTQEDFVEYMTGRKISADTFTFNNDQSPPLLEVRGLTKRGVFEDISFTLRQGEIIGITGLLGSGKSELALSLFGAMKVDHGAILLDGKTINNTIQDSISKRIGYVPEDRLSEGLFLPQSIRHNITSCRHKDLAGFLSLTNVTKMDRLSQQYIRELGILCNKSTDAVQMLSGGNQQKVVVARWLSTNPAVLIFNGPTIGVDIAAKYDMHGIIRKLARQGVGVLIFSDDMPEVYANCNRIFIMKNGRFEKSLINTDTSIEELTSMVSEQ